MTDISDYFGRINFVSIHTPTQGVTPFQGETSIFILVSIHTPTQGVTHYTYPYSTSLKFQSTHPRRVWQSRDGYQGDNEGFNPHTHAGCDTNSPDIGTDGLVSIHTPTQGVTSKSGYGVTSHHVSIHTPTQGVTFSIRNKTVLLQFQSTHPRRVWQFACNVYTQYASFNPHTHAGCDLYKYDGIIPTKQVSIHTPTQGVTV